jgi:UDP:flavonoid glycosyltransferase YjiC (YdhE family)
MGKPVLMVPTHIEQSCNAFEASSVGAGITADDFNLEKLLEYIPEYKKNTNFRDWVQQAHLIFIKEFRFNTKELIKNRLSYSFVFKWS